MYVQEISCQQTPLKLSRIIKKNIEVEYIETPTAMAYSSNKLSVALYPVCVEFKPSEDGPVHKGAIAFISDDKIHDHQQVQAFEKRMFEIVRNDYGLNVLHWQRRSDGCGAQFKSKFVNADLLNAEKSFQLENASFSYFEAHEGKNTSDTIGSLVKCAFLKGMAKENQGIGNATDIVEVVKRNTKKETEKFDFFVVEEFPPINRIEEEDREEFEIVGISKVHQLYVRDDGLIADERSCHDCSLDRLCKECYNKEFYQIINEETDDGEESANEIYDEDDLGCSDYDDDTSDDEKVHNPDSNFGPGSIVWGKYGRTSAKVVEFNQLPERIQARLGKARRVDSVILRWYGEDTYSWVKVRNLDELSENKCDTAKTSVNDEIHHRYQSALADLRND